MFKLSINNYRGFSNEIFDFRKINILIGENSSGKSSLIKFLLTLEKSFTQANSSFNFGAANIGRYEDFVYEHDNHLEISFSIYLGEEYYEFFKAGFHDSKEWKNIIKILDSSPIEEREVQLKFIFDKSINQSNNVIVEIESKRFGKIRIERNKKNEKERILIGKSCTIFYNDNEEKIEFNDIGYDQYGFMTHIHGSDLRKKIIELYGDEDDLLYFEMGFLLIAQNYFEYILEQIVYVNPLESKPERVYSESEKQGLYPIKDIRDVVNILTDETLEDHIKDSLLNKLNNILSKYGILHKLIPINSGFGAKELRVQIVEDGIQHNIQDVGYGSALQIPIFFQSIISNENGGHIIIIEQPEVHIHPKLQAKFIELLIESGPLNTYIIETHSVDLLRKLQVIVKRKFQDINSDDISIYYFKKSDNNKGIISHHCINEHGKLNPKFPEGFYDNSIGLINDLLL